MTTTLTTIELSCPVCHTRFVSRAARVAGAVRARRTDFHEQSWDAPFVPHLVHACRRCGYAGLEAEFSADATIDPRVVERVWEELAPRIGPNELTGSEKYEFAARIASWQGAESRQIGDLWLRAAWCCVEERDSEAERYYRRFAVRAFEDALATYDGIARDERAVTTYLVGELWRRIGDQRTAAAWFDRVADEVTIPRAQRWIVDAALRQKTSPREWFTAL
jgi:uncharacterized protein